MDDHEHGRISQRGIYACRSRAERRLRPPEVLTAVLNEFATRSQCVGAGDEEPDTSFPRDQTAGYADRGERQRVAFSLARKGIATDLDPAFMESI
jgi:hypothetical protein